MILRLISIIILIILVILIYRYIQQYGLHLDTESMKTSVAQSFHWMTTGISGLFHSKPK